MPLHAPVIDLSEARLTRALCVLLVIQAVVSYRSVPRILGLFKTETMPGLAWIPHFTSVINWTLRLGLGLLNQVKAINTRWLAIIDHSIDIGTKKVLVVLRVPVDVLANKGAAIQLQDCECIGLKVCEQVHGESIALDLAAIFSQAGAPAAIIKDGDYTLAKGVRLWSGKHDIPVPVIADIGHAMAIALKDQFEKTAPLPALHRPDHPGGQAFAANRLGVPDTAETAYQRALSKHQHTGQVGGQHA